MPNQRSKNKIYLGGFVDRAVHQEIVRLARQAGMANNKFGFVTRLIEQALQRKRRPVAGVAKSPARPANRRPAAGHLNKR